MMAEQLAKVAFDTLVQKRMDAVPNQDTRTNGPYKTYEFFRVNAKADVANDGNVQVVRIEDAVMKYDYCGSMGMERMQQGIRAANADSTIDSIVLLIDSPGGTVDGTYNLAAEISSSAKPVVSFINGMMCSAAYWIGSSAREVIADTANNGYNATIGSIGTMCQWVDWTGSYEKEGAKIHTVYASKSKRKGKYMNDANGGNYDRLVNDLDKINETFIAAVSSNRNGKLSADAEDVFEGDVYNAKEALKLGLIDKMAGFDYAVKRSLQLAKTIR